MTTEPGVPFYSGKPVFRVILGLGSRSHPEFRVSEVTQNSRFPESPGTPGSQRHQELRELGNQEFLVILISVSYEMKIRLDTYVTALYHNRYTDLETHVSYLTIDAISTVWKLRQLSRYSDKATVETRASKSF